PRAAQDDGGRHGRRRVRGDGQEGAREQHALDPRQSREDEIFGADFGDRGALSALAHARRRAALARGARARASDPEVSVRFAYDLFAYPLLIVVILAALLLVGFAATLVAASFARARAEKRF